MPRFYCDFCDAYLTHDSVSAAVQAAACLASILGCLCSLALSDSNVLRSKIPPCAVNCLSSHVALADVFVMLFNLLLLLQPAVRSQHNSGYKHKVNNKPN